MSEPRPVLRREVSVVVPARNAALTIAEQLEALRSQEFDGDVEFVVVDNGSSDATNSIASSFAVQDHRFRVVTEDVPGVNNARNAGFRHARFEAVLLCDADDIVEPGWITALFGGLEFADYAGGRMAYDRLNTERGLARWGVDASRIEIGRSPVGGNCAMRRSMWDALGGFDSALSGAGDETEFFMRAEREGHVMAPVDGAVVHYRLPSELGAILRRQYRFSRDRVLTPVDAAASTAHMSARRVAWLVRHAPLLPFSAAIRASSWRVAATQAGVTAGLVQRWRQTSAQSTSTSTAMDQQPGVPAELTVLYIIDSFLAGGAEASLAALIPHVADRGVRIEVATLFERNHLLADFEATGARLHAIRARGGRAGRMLAVARLVRGVEPDLVHTTLFEADVAGRVGARLARRPVVTSLVNESYGPDHHVPGRLGPTKLALAHLLDTLTARLACRFHANSAAVMATMAQRLHVPAERCEVVHRGRSAAALGARTTDRVSQARTELNITDADFVLLAVGRHEHQKGIDVALAAMALLPAELDHVRLLVAGREGEQSDALRSMSVALDVAHRVSWLGHRDDVASLMCAADALVFPTRREGLPGTVIEAMALRLPIIASDIGPVREVVGDSPPCATLVPVDDAERLSRAIIALATDPTIAGATVDEASRRFASLFTVESAADGMVAFYRRAVGAAPARGRRHG